MLDLQNVLWVIPGVLFIYFYNRRRTHDIINLSGWPYLFLIVVIALFTWLPAKWITLKILIYEEPYSLIESISQQIITALISIILVTVLFLITQWKPILKFISVPVYDNFYNKCVAWENKFVLLTLRTGKAYIGILWKYPEIPKSRHESQTISIIPFKSGHRDEDAKKIDWNTDYPEYNDESQFVDMEIIIPRSEIITFGKFNKKIFEHFYSDNNFLKKER